MFSLKRKTRKKSPLFFVVCILIAVLLSGVFSSAKNDCTVTIGEGLSTVQIADALKEKGVIRSKFVFLAAVNFSSYKGKLKYGDFEFSKGDGYFDVIEKLANDGAKKETVSVTVPEGYSVEKIIDKLVSVNLGTKNEFEKALNDEYDYEFIKHIKSTSECKYRLQGFLFPATYEFFTDDSPHKIIDTMLKEFDKQYSSLGASYDNIYDTIIKASLIEREAKIDSERAKIAGVIENRLKKGMKLQIDATVVYAVSDGMYDVERVLYRDLETNSPYNTYVITGLPAGPIANPGLKSIKAALSPEAHSYLYYRTDTSKNDGSHIFTENFEAHTNANQ